MKSVLIVALWALLAQGIAGEVVAGEDSRVALLALYEGASGLAVAALWAQFRPEARPGARRRPS